MPGMKDIRSFETVRGSTGAPRLPPIIGLASRFRAARGFEYWNLEFPFPDPGHQTPDPKCKP